MEKKRPVGVTVFGIAGIIYGSLILLGILFYMGYIGSIPSYMVSYVLILIFFGIGFAVSAIYILKLINLARLVFICLMIFYLLAGVFPAYALIIVELADVGILAGLFLMAVYLLFFLLPSVASIVFFTRPKVKEQFK